MTLVNQEPGPSTIQSASETASSASGQAGGFVGDRSTESTCPPVEATSTWPHTVLSSSGLPGSRP